MSRRWVEYRGRIVPGFVFEPELNPPPGACAQCGGLGLVPETIDEERYDVMVPCWACQKFCKPCNKYVKKSGHQCVAPEVKP